MHLLDRNVSESVVGADLADELQLRIAQLAAQRLLRRITLRFWRRCGGNGIIDTGRTTHQTDAETQSHREERAVHQETAG